jgi:putative endonuclease
MHGVGKRFVYILRSDSNPDCHYVGLTSDPEGRLDWHNHGPCGQTVRNRPWSFVVVLEFQTEQQAVRFEKYLKSGSGRASATRHSGGTFTQPAESVDQL